MDVLKEVKKAEDEARKIEEEYKDKIDNLLLSVNAEAEKTKQKLDKDLKDKLKSYGDELDKQFDEEKAKIIKESEQERKKIEIVVEKNRENFINQLLDKLS
ncbi:MAG: hypothetical protein GXP33_05475 [Spirochaetes bacterium]|nr:hypothetical protein [Spirochaetota bacterium]